MTPVQQQLFALQDIDYKAFHSRLIPNIEADRVIGVRMPALRKLAKAIYHQGGYETFLQELPHHYYEENNLHGTLICLMTDYHPCVAALDTFLPHVDNWATCDLMRPKAFDIAAKRHPALLIDDIHRWITSEHTYTIRFGMEMLMTYFLDSCDTTSPLSPVACFRQEYLDWVANDRHEHYYVRMMVAWFFATALAKQYDATLPYIENHVLPVWTHNKAIQKAVESFRITDSQKAYLKTLKQR